MNGRLYDLFAGALDPLGLRKLRAELLSRAQGKTLELGAGTGLNFSHYPRGVRLFAIEPDPGMLDRARTRAARAAASVGSIVLKEADAEHLPFSVAEFDTVAATLVFCTIPRPEKALAEVKRVLKPGGTFLLLEHIRRDSLVVGRAQAIITPCWKHLASGCHLDRDPTHELTRLGFVTENERTLWRGLGKLWVLKRP